MKRFILLIIILYSANIVFAQRGITSTAGAKSISLGGAGVALEGIEALYHNQAGLVNSGKWNIQVNSERRFSLSELTAISIGTSYNIDKLGVFGFVFNNFGFDAFNEQKLGLSYARKLTEGFNIGIQLDMLTTNIEGFGSNSVFTFELGIQYKITSDLLFGAHIFNPTRVEISQNTEIPSQLRLGLQYQLNEAISILAEADKAIDSPINFKSGIAYEIASAFNIRAGFSTNPGTLSIGVAYIINENAQIDGAYSYHEILGLTPAISAKFGR